MHLEFKSTLRTGASTGEVVKALETSVVKSIAAFANGRDGGTLLIGVADDGTVHGVESDYVSLHKDGKDDRDRFGLHLGQLLVNSLGAAAASAVSTKRHTVEGRDLWRLHVPPSAFPVEAQVKVEVKGQQVSKAAFYVRVGNGTRDLGNEPEEKGKYVATRWGSLETGTEP